MYIKLFINTGIQFSVSKNLSDFFGTNNFIIIFISRYTRFIDTFGARPSGTEVLERSIDHMINLTKYNGLNDVTTEELEVNCYNTISTKL